MIEQDFTWEEQLSFVIKKEILWHSYSATDGEVRNKEIELIREYRANDPDIGYNRLPRFKPEKEN
jgi:hypothetical protein